jgi:lysophospholipase L1-like esterase
MEPHQCLLEASRRETVDNDMSRYWQRKHAQFAQARANQPLGAIVFMGDSLTERFDLDLWLGARGRKPFINRGIGGDKVGGGRYLGLIDRVDDIVQLAPHTLVIMIGINDLVFAQTPERQMQVCYAVLLDEVSRRLPNTRVVTVATLPAPRFAWADPALGRWNTYLGQVARQRQVTHIDLVAFMGGLNSDELAALYDADGLHLSPTGYQRWAKMMAGHLPR